MVEQTDQLTILQYNTRESREAKAAIFIRQTGLLGQFKTLDED